MSYTKDLRGTKGRPFLETHPWISFKLDLQKAPIELWMMLGEARSKCEHIAGVPLIPAVAQKLQEVYLAKGVYATTHIEGNTLTEEQIRKQIKQKKKIKIPKIQEHLFDETQNIIDACNEISREMMDNPATEITPERICHFNRLVLRGKAHGKEVRPGEVRKQSVGVADYRGAPWQDCEFLLQRLCDWLNKELVPDNPDRKFMYALIKAIMAHLYLAWIHPFDDGNGRTARLIEFQLLIQSGLVPFPAGHLLSNHYNQTRMRYYHELSKASKSGGDVVPFLLYAIEGFVEGLRHQLIYIRGQQFHVTWENFVHDQFKDTKVDSRRKHLLLDLPFHPVQRNDLTKVSARVAKEYAGTAAKTLARDIQELEKANLLIRKEGGYLPNRNLILAFLPLLCEEWPADADGEPDA
jgi:Fic family protein